MFETLRMQFTKLENEGDTASGGPGSTDPAPPATWMPPMGASAKTWHNIMSNKNNIDYCVTQFHYLGNRIKCINTMTGGPFLE